MSDRQIKPCTVGKRHKWAFVKNQIHTTYMGNSARIRKIGVYKCECGQRKIGQADINEVVQ